MEIPRHWRLKKQRYALVGEVCPHCQAKIFPPRDVCPNCGGEAKNRIPLQRQGRSLFLHRHARRPGRVRREHPLHRGPGQAGRRPDGHRPADRPGRPGRCRSACRSRWSRARSARMGTSEGCWCTGISLGRCCAIEILEVTKKPRIEQSNRSPEMGGAFCFSRLQYKKTRLLYK